MSLLFWDRPETLRPLEGEVDVEVLTDDGSEVVHVATGLSGPAGMIADAAIGSIRGKNDA